MQLTRSEKWALAARRAAKSPLALDLAMSAMFPFILTSWLVGRFLDGRLAVLDFAFLEFVGFAAGSVAAFWMFERRGFARLLDAKDQEIQELRGQRGPAEPLLWPRLSSHVPSPGTDF